MLPPVLACLVGRYGAPGGCSTLEAELEPGLWFLVVDTASAGPCGAWRVDVTGL